MLVPHQRDCPVVDFSVSGDLGELRTHWLLVALKSKSFGAFCSPILGLHHNCFIINRDGLRSQNCGRFWCWIHWICIAWYAVTATKLSQWIWHTVPGKEAQKTMKNVLLLDKNVVAGSFTEFASIITGRRCVRFLNSGPFKEPIHASSEEIVAPMYYRVQREEFG